MRPLLQDEDLPEPQLIHRFRHVKTVQQLRCGRLRIHSVLSSELKNIFLKLLKF